MILTEALPALPGGMRGTQSKLPSANTRMSNILIARTGAAVASHASGGGRRGSWLPAAGRREKVAEETCVIVERPGTRWRYARRRMEPPVGQARMDRLTGAWETVETLIGRVALEALTVDAMHWMWRTP